MPNNSDLITNPPNITSMSIGEFFKKLLAPDSASNSELNEGVYNSITRQNVLDSLRAAFNHSLNEETTTESMLCHTFYKVYINESYYEKISASFHKTAEDAVKVFTRTLKTKLSNYPDFTPFSTRWEFQLIPLTEGQKVQGLDDSDCDNCIAIVSRLWAPNTAIGEDEANGEREVVTFHDKNSMREIPKGFNSAVLQGMIAAEKDKAIFRFTLDDTVATVNASGPTTKQSSALATIKITGGTFIDGNRTFTTYTMKNSSLRIAGKNGSTGNDGIPVLCVNSDKILNHHIEIALDSSTKKFKINTLGEARLNERKLTPGINTWEQLPKHSNISIDDIDLTFKAQ